MDLSGLSNATTSATALSNLVLVVPAVAGQFGSTDPRRTVGYQPTLPGLSGPLQAPPPALLFHYEGENSFDLEADITDHYVEDNTAVQDQIALKPEIVTVRGFIGEVNDVPPYGLQTLKVLVDKLTDIAAYSPALSVTAQEAYNTAFELYQVATNAANSAVAAYNSLAGEGGENVIGNDGLTGFSATTGKVANSQSKQQVAFQQFYGYYTARALFTVQTPWAVVQNMAIWKLRAVQDETTNQITDFLVTFKRIRTASTAFQSAASLQGRLQSQAAGIVDHGTTSPTSSGDLTTSISGMK